TVTGQGFPPGTAVNIGQCSPLVSPDPGIHRCNLSRFVQTTSDSDGAFTATFEVQRMLLVDGVEYDCASEPPAGLPSACNVAAAPSGDYGVNGTVPILFDPGASVLERPQLVVGQIDGLVDMQTVEV